MGGEESGGEYMAIVGLGGAARREGEEVRIAEECLNSKVQKIQSKERRETERLRD